MGKTGKKIRESKKRMRKTRKWVRKSNKKRGGGSNDSTIKVGSILRINNTNYEVNDILPEGSTCEVYKVIKEGTTNEIYAVKAIYKKHEIAANRELKILNLLKKHCSEFILCIKDHDFTNQRYNYIVSEYIDNDLLDPNTKVTARLVDQLCRAVIKLHQLGIAHRDIKPDNIGEKGNNIKMIDFGNAIYKNDYDPNNYTEAGTYSYIYPELYKTPSPSFDLLQQSDVWSLGITIFNLIHGIFTYMFVNGGIMNIHDLNIPPLIDKFIEFAANPTEYKEKNNLSKVLEQEADKLFNEIMVKADALFEQGKQKGLYTINLREILTGKPENQKIYVPSTAIDPLPVTAVRYTPSLKRKLL